MASILTHSQYEALRIYEDGRSRYTFRAPPRSLTLNGHLRRTPNSGETRESSAFAITPQGVDALATYRRRYRLQEAAS